MRKSLAMLVIAIMVAVTFSGFASATDDVSGDSSVQGAPESPCSDGINENPCDECNSHDGTDEEQKDHCEPKGHSEIQGTVWNDSNKDGIQDPDEKGMANVTVNLWKGNETDPITKIANTTTDENGNYRFEHLFKGIYWLQFIAPTSSEGTWKFTLQDQGDNDYIDSDTNAAGLVGPICLGKHNCDEEDAGLVFDPFVPAAAGGEEVVEIVEEAEIVLAAGGEETVPMEKTGLPILPGVLAALMIGGGLLERKLRK